MIETKCSKCDFHSKSSINSNLSQCPICSSELETKILKKKKHSLPNMVNKKKFELELDEHIFKFKLISVEEENICQEFSMVYEVKYIEDTRAIAEYADPEKYPIAILAMSLDYDMPFLEKYDYLIHNFSKDQINLLNMKLNSYVKDNFACFIDMELDKIIESTQTQMEKIELLNQYEKKIENFIINTNSPEDNSI